MKLPKRHVLRIFGIMSITTVLGFFNNCGAPKSASFSSSSGSASSVAGLNSFSAGTYTFARAINCQTCHATLIRPFFASPDITLAYNEAKSVVNFDSPEGSILAAHAGDSHCGIAACADPANVATMKSYLKTWASAEHSSGSVVAPTMAYLTKEVAVPTTLPDLTAANPAVMRFRLADLNRRRPR